MASRHGVQKIRFAMSWLDHTLMNYLPIFKGKYSLDSEFTDRIVKIPLRIRAQWFKLARKRAIK